MNERPKKIVNGGHMGPPTEKAKDFSGSIKKLIKYGRSYLPAVIVVTIFAILSTIFAIVGPKILGHATDKVFIGVISKSVYNEIHEQMPDKLLNLLPDDTTVGNLNDKIKELPKEVFAKMPKHDISKMKETKGNSSAENVPAAYKDAVMNTKIHTEPKIDFSGIKDIMVFLMTIFLLSSVFSYIQAFIMAGVSQKIAYKLRNDIFEKMNKLPISYYDKNTHGDILSRVTNDVDTVSQTLNQSLSQLVTSITTLIGILVMMISISIAMTGIAVVTLPISMILIMIVVKKSQGFFKQQQQSLADINGHVEEMYAGHNVVKAFNYENRSIETFQKYNNSLYTAGWKSQFFSGLMMPIMQFIGNLGFVFVCVFGGYLVIKGKINIGGVQAFTQYIRQFNQPVSQAAQVMNVLQSTAAASERVFEFLEESEEIPDVENPVSIENIAGEISFDHVEFGYNPDKIIINDFSANIKPGQTIAIVGPTGAGKTTIVKLLMRFYDLNSGKIKIDGHSITEFNRKDLRDLFGMVLQDAWLFNGTIMENIRYGRLDSTDEEVIAAAKAAHVHHFVKTLPGGYNMILNEEASNVSLGQKQLLTIARAILANPKILILDEATSSVDTRTEVLIQKAMTNLMKGRTNFVIAHRLSTIRDADLIFVMKDGDIIEQGSHDLLLEQNGFYASLYNSQFETGETEEI